MLYLFPIQSKIAGTENIKYVRQSPVNGVGQNIIELAKWKFDNFDTVDTNVLVHILYFGFALTFTTGGVTRLIIQHSTDNQNWTDVFNANRSQVGATTLADGLSAPAIAFTGNFFLRLIITNTDLGTNWTVKKIKFVGLGVLPDLVKITRLI